MKTVNLKLKFIRILAHYRSGVIAIIVHIISIFLFGLGLASKSNFVQEYSTFIIFYAGFISIINSLDLGYSLVIAKGEALYIRGLLYFFSFSVLFSAIASLILDTMFDLRTHYLLLFVYLLLGFWLNIIRAFFDRIKWFILGTLFGNHFLLSFTVVPAFLYSPKSFSEWWTINVFLSGLLLLIAILMLYRSKSIEMKYRDSLNISWKQIQVNWKMSLIYFQGNFNGRIDRFLFPMLFISNLPAVFLFVNEASHRLLFLTSSVIRFNIPEYGNGNKSLGTLNVIVKSRILFLSLGINSLIIFGSVIWVNESLDTEYLTLIVFVYALAGSIVVLSQYEFFRLIIEKSYNVIIKSQLIGILVFALFVILSNACLLLVALGYLSKCIAEYIILASVNRKRLF